MDNKQHIEQSQNTEEEEGFFDSLDFDKIFEILIKSIPWIVIINALSIFGAYTYLRYTHDVFESSSILKLEKEGEESINFFKLNQEDSNNELLGEIEIIQSELIYNALIEAMPALKTTYYAEGNILDRELYKESPFDITDSKILNPSFYNKRIDIDIENNKTFDLSYQSGEEIITKTYAFNKKIITKDFEFRIKRNSRPLFYTNFYFLIHDKRYLINYLGKRLKAGLVNPKANTLSISFTGYNPSKVKDIVNIADTVYIQKSLEYKNLQKKKQSEYIDEQLKKAEDSLSHYEQQLENFVIENKTGDAENKMEEIVRQLEGLIKKKNDYVEKLSLLMEIESSINTDSTVSRYLTALVILDNTELIQKIEATNEAIHKINKKKQKIKNRKLLGSSYLDLEKQKNDLFKSIDLYKRVVYRQISKVQTQITETQSQMLGLPSKGTYYRRLERQKQIYEQLYLNNLNKQVELGIAEAGTVPESVILSPATLPTVPILPKKLQIYLVAAGIGIFLSAVVVALRYLAHNTITNIKELEKVVDMSILGAVPEYRKPKGVITSLVVKDNPKSMVNEAFRAIRTNLEFMLPAGKKLLDNSKEGILLSITSTVSGEGKTFIASNLAGIISSLDLDVVVIDCDMRRPKLHEAFGVENSNEFGVSNILIGKKSIEECIRKSEMTHLSYISAGVIPPNPSELILRKDFNNLLDNLKRNFQVVIIDTPPVGLVTDSALIMKKVDLPIYVVRANYSKKAFGKNVNKLAQRNKIDNLSIVLNAAKKKGVGYYDNNYYTGGYYEEKLPKKNKSIFSIFKRNKK